MLIISALRFIFSKKPRLHILTHKKKYLAFTIVILLLDSVFIHIAITMNEISDQIEREVANRKARQNFSLKIPRQYGELLLPAGTQIERYDPFDKGEENRAFRLTGLHYAKFPQEIDIAGVWSSAMYTNGRLILSKDQIISGLECKKDQIALFHIPLIKYDVAKEFGKEEPDGPNARFKPSQWEFQECMTP